MMALSTVERTIADLAKNLNASIAGARPYLAQQLDPSVARLLSDLAELIHAILPARVWPRAPATTRYVGSFSSSGFFIYNKSRDAYPRLTHFYVQI